MPSKAQLDYLILFRYPSLQPKRIQVRIIVWPFTDVLFLLCSVHLIKDIRPSLVLALQRTTTTSGLKDLHIETSVQVARMRLGAALVQFTICYLCSHTTIKDRCLDHTWHYETYLIRGRTIACGTNIQREINILRLSMIIWSNRQFHNQYPIHFHMSAYNCWRGIKNSKIGTAALRRRSGTVWSEANAMTVLPPSVLLARARRCVCYSPLNQELYRKCNPDFSDS